MVQYKLKDNVYLKPNFNAFLNNLHAVMQLTGLIYVGTLIWNYDMCRNNLISIMQMNKSIPYNVNTLQDIELLV